jgi:predicted HicB family RNase H-like nuclease
MKKSGETPPVPLASRFYSGKFVVRVPPSVHRNLVIKAAEEGVSLNRLISARLLGI